MDGDHTMSTGFFFQCMCADTAADIWANRPRVSCRLWYTATSRRAATYWRLMPYLEVPGPHGERGPIRPYDEHFFVSFATNGFTSYAFNETELSAMVAVLPIVVPAEVLERAVQAEQRIPTP